MIIIGSWCLLVYEDYFQDVSYRAGIRTRDIDFLIPLPPKFDHQVDMETLLKDLDFVRSMKGQGGYMQFVHADLMLEFIVPERGRGSEKPIDIPALGINAQPLRFMDFLADHPIRLSFAGVQLLVPHPVNFALIKTIISARRQNSAKRENDLRQAIEVFRALIARGEADLLKERFKACPTKWRKSIIKTLADQPLTEEIREVLL
jgi:hypothetical protein